jgi:hypothetical protein
MNPMTPIQARDGAVYIARKVAFGYPDQVRISHGYNDSPLNLP